MVSKREGSSAFASDLAEFALRVLTNTERTNNAVAEGFKNTETRYIRFNVELPADLAGLANSSKKQLAELIKAGEKAVKEQPGLFAGLPPL